MDRFKRKVLLHHPKAVAKQWSEGWVIERSVAGMGLSPQLSSAVKTEDEAWKDAASKL